MLKIALFYINDSVVLHILDTETKRSFVVYKLLYFYDTECFLNWNSLYLATAKEEIKI